MSTTVHKDWTALSATTTMVTICARKGAGLFATGSAPSNDIDAILLREGDTITVNAGITPYVKADPVSGTCTFVVVPIGT